jgi:hypothetical protein
MSILTMSAFTVLVIARVDRPCSLQTIVHARIVHSQLVPSIQPAHGQQKICKNISNPG